MTRNMYFFVKWRKWIGECISSTSSSILVSGFSMEEFLIRKVHGQGDPLSIFFIVVEGLYVMLKSSSNECLFTDHTIRDSQNK